MEKSDLSSTDALKGICNRLVVKHPDAVGMAVIELDCGCVDICGVSIRGEPVGSIKTIALGADARQQQSPICSRCLASKERVSERVVNRRIIWPGSEEERPDVNLRRFIGRVVFGENWTE
ncbi:MAG: hypothetical protein AMJ54_11615 [Deltaproteobacteria bacterium SG8_13]|nr:MAG: hypothetical protein AMJ54_11615 [Deltaproteobacteria bacterium SG8_13]